MGISYSVEVDEERSAKAMGRELPISRKDAVELCRHVKGMPLDEAQATLRSIAEGETPLPRKRHNTGVGHESGIDGWDAGNYPEKAADALGDVLYNAESNATNQGYDPDEMVVEHIAAHKVGESRGMKPRAMGRATQWNSDLIDIEVVLLQEDYDPGAEEEAEEQEVEQEAEEADEAEVDEEEDDLPSQLTDVTGVGESKAEAFREAGYETPEDLREASLEDLEETEDVGKALAAQIKSDVGGVDVGDEAQSETEGSETEDAEEEAGASDDDEAQADEDETEQGGNS